MNKPRKAIILAAGLGTRLRPLTSALPKPLMPLWDIPLLEHTLRLLEAWGVEEIAVNTHWLPQTIEAYLATRKGTARTQISFEPEILGTGGALRPLRAFLGDEPFWMINADIAAAVEPEPLMAAFEQGDRLAAVWLEPKKGPRTVEMDRKGRVTCWRSPTPGVEHTFTFCGLQLLSPRIFDYLPEAAFCSIVEGYQRAMQAGIFATGVAVAESYWDDAGTIEAYLRIHGEVKKLAQKQKVGGGLYSAAADRLPATDKHFFCVGGVANVPRTVKGVDSVIAGEVELRAGTQLKDCVIMGGRLGGELENVVAFPVAADAPATLRTGILGLGWDCAKVSVAFLGERGSDRTFWRVWNGAESAVVVGYALTRPENGRYSGHAHFLAAQGVRVPRLRVDQPDAQVLVLEDWGDASLQRLMGQRPRPKQIETWYRQVIEALAQFHQQGEAAERSGVVLEKPFDADLYAWERTLFEQELLIKRFGYDALPEDVAEELKQVAAKLQAGQQVLVHRDFQSSNVLFKGGALALIDFQGMRMGAGAYDLASLLFDPYVSLEREMRVRLAGYYTACYAANPDAERLLHEGAIQRLVQALGAYGRLAGVGQHGFTRYILPALENLLDAADTCGCEALGALAEELIARENSRT